MNNGFIVSIPKDLSTIKSKLFMGLTKRQLIGFGLGIVSGIPFYLFTFRINADLAMYGTFIIMAPFFIGTVYKKDKLYADKWLKIVIAQKFIYGNERKYKATKRNLNIAKERKIVRVRKKKPVQNTSKNIQE